MPSPQLLELLRAWWLQCRSKGWLFPGRDPLLPMTVRQDATHYQRLFADRAALAVRQPCQEPHRVTRQNGASVALRQCRCAPPSSQSRHQVAFHADQRHLVCRVSDSSSTSPHSPKCGRTGQRKTCQRIIRVDCRLTLSFPLTRAERDWQTVSNSAVIATTCQAG